MSTQSPYQFPSPPDAPASTKKARRWPWIAGGGIVITLAALIGLSSAPSTPGPASPVSSAAPVTSSAPAPVYVPVAPTTTVAPPPPAPTGPALQLTSREWALLAKSPDSHVGERVIIYGSVTQFDSATGLNIFRANVDGAKHSQSYEYDTNALLTGARPGMFDNVVLDDMFRAEVTITGSYSYTSTLNATLTVPQMQADKIDVIG